MRATVVKAVRVVPQGESKARKVAAAVVVDPSVAFAEVVRGRMDGPVLRYSQRLALLKEAQRMGVGRFEANLVIARVLYQEGLGQEYELRPEQGRGWAGVVMTIVLVQSAILAGAWWVFW